MVAAEPAAELASLQVLQATPTEKLEAQCLSVHRASYPPRIGLQSVTNQKSATAMIQPIWSYKSLNQ